MTRFRLFFFIKNNFLLFILIFLFGKINITIAQSEASCYAEAVMPNLYETINVTTKVRTSCGGRMIQEIKKVEVPLYEGTDSMMYDCLLYTSPSPRDRTRSRMPSSA